MGKEEFSYRATKDEKVFVRWHGGDGKREIAFKGARAGRLLAELSGADRERETANASNSPSRGPRATSNEGTSDARSVDPEGGR